MNVSILILTLNEEINLMSCLESVKWSDDIVVFDSFSTDRTLEIAKAMGARVFQRKFDNYAAQRNAALKEVQYKYPWILMIDSDELVAPELRIEIEMAINQSDDDTCLFRVRRKDMFFGQWLKRSSGYPTWFGRLFRTGRVWVEREINEEYCTDGNIGFLQEHLIHYPFNKGIAYWYERHNRYSSMEASVFVQETQEKLQIGDFFSQDPVIRRKLLKQLAFRLYGRPFLVFCYLYIIRLGFLDGKAGFMYSLLRSFYEVMIDLKVQEIRRREKNLPI